MTIQESIAASLKSDKPFTAANIVIDRLDCNALALEDKKISLSRFSYVGFKGTHFVNCSFNHSYFDRCYFRKARFTNVSFVGCTFTDCRFGEAEFDICSFDEAEFDNCSIAYEQLSSSLPTRQNVLWRLARSLRVNSQNRGQTEDARKFLLVELKASETHNYKKAFAWNEPFYKKKYRPEDRLSGGWRWLLSQMSNFFWGYGELPTRVVRFAAIIVLLFAFAFYRQGNLRNMPAGAGFLEYLGFSLSTFATSTYGEITPGTSAARALATIESISGLVMFGFFVASLYRRVSKR